MPRKLPWHRVLKITVTVEKHAAEEINPQPSHRERDSFLQIRVFNINLSDKQLF